MKAKLIKRLQRDLILIKKGLAKEKDETIEMLSIYKQATLSLGNVDKKELARAHAQFFDVIKGTGLGFLAIMPFAPITIPLVLKLAAKFNIDLLPSAFKRQ